MRFFIYLPTGEEDKTFNETCNGSLFMPQDKMPQLTFLLNNFIIPAVLYVYLQNASSFAGVRHCYELGAQLNVKLI